MEENKKEVEDVFVFMEVQENVTITIQGNNFDKKDEDEVVYQDKKVEIIYHDYSDIENKDKVYKVKVKDSVV